MVLILLSKGKRKNRSKETIKPTTRVSSIGLVTSLHTSSALARGYYIYRGPY